MVLQVKPHKVETPDKPFSGYKLWSKFQQNQYSRKEVNEYDK